MGGNVPVVPSESRFRHHQYTGKPAMTTSSPMPELRRVLSAMSRVRQMPMAQTMWRTVSKC